MESNCRIALCRQSNAWEGVRRVGGGVVAMCKQEMAGWLVGGVNTWHEFVSISIGVSPKASLRTCYYCAQRVLS